ncbi:serine/threonine-protein kinase [Paraburkholderia rhizosphaerae]|uniref:non-specific serine/threonine protein kinase n=1 Tax=Paraburkholderia rhizosphaerae TaxID=480658 RepID=A0A4V3HFE2_9BURK|nr:serine/threonine-protein kinase [Paraburkholderia rhizosphaerae]TDY52768.1 serine/threonine-protein kinase [Paraburkholderia rhizosphaerae]
MIWQPESLPRQIGRYRVERVLGRGAMGVVYLATDPHIQRHVALKTIRTELLRDGLAGPASVADAQLPERFVNEARAAGRLAHPHIVAVFDYGEADGAAFIALEYVRGESLAERLAHHAQSATTMPLARALVWFAQLLDALAYAHELGVIHRDIKPANLMIAQRGECKVTDFGIAQLDTSRLTRAGMMIGTPSYMSPEQFSGEPIDARSDLFSAGVVLHEILTGVCPFTGTAAAVMQQVLNEMPPAPSQRVAGVPPELDAMVLKALAKRPDDRYASAQSWRVALLTLLDSLTAADDPDRTVLVAPLTRAALAPPQPPSAARVATAETTAPGGVIAGAAGHWPPELLAQLEQRLASYVGPVATRLIRRAAAQASDSQTLSAQLARHLPDDAARREFDALLARHAAQANATSAAGSVRAAGAAVSGGGVVGGSGSAAGGAMVSAPPARAGVPLDPQRIDAAARRLASHIGPIARIVAARAARGADAATFHARLADALPATADKAAFLRELDDSSG